MTNSLNSQKEIIEQLLLEEFKKHPFHNLFFLNLLQPNSGITGGTCSDKCLLFKESLAQQQITTRLHSAHINAQHNHRLLAIPIAGQLFFADVGNAWPSIQLFPADQNITYHAFGITFESVVNRDHVDVYQHKSGIRSLSLQIPRKVQAEHHIQQQIKERFQIKEQYPFNDGIRFAQVINNDFLFFKKNKLRIFKQNHVAKEIIANNKNEVLSLLKQYFNIQQTIIL